METDAGHVVTQVNQLCGIGKRKGLQQHALDYGEDGAVRANADRQRCDGDGSECWEVAESAEDVFECGHILVSPPCNREDVEQAHSVSSITHIPAFQGFQLLFDSPIVSRSWQGWWTRGDSNPRPPHCERGKFQPKTWYCNHLGFAERPKLGYLGYQATQATQATEAT
jgi:hypothetical protein